MTVRIGDSILSTSAPIFETIANTNLSNLSEAGQAKFDEKANKDFSNVVEIAEGSLVDNELKNKLNKQQITNCLLEVPQRIKYTLEDGTLTIKAGSVIIVPYGITDKTSQLPIGSTFLNADFKVYDTQFADGKFFVWAELVNDIGLYFEHSYTGANFLHLSLGNSQGKLFTMRMSNSYSGTTDTLTETDQHGFYNTDENMVYEYNTTGKYTAIFTLPLFVIYGNGVQLYDRIDQIFNGIGYIGGTVWVDKGVKGLAVNGKNADGTYMNKEVVFDSISISPTVSVTNQTPFYVYMGTNNKARFAGKLTHFEQNEKPTLPSAYGAWYSPTENVLRFTNDKGVTWIVADSYVLIADVIAANNTITEFKPRETFRAISYSDKSTVVSWAMPSNKYIQLTLGASGTTYTAPANGYFALTGTVTSELHYIYMASNNISIQVTGTNINQQIHEFIPVKKGANLFITYSNVNDFKFRFIYAEGEVS